MHEHRLFTLLLWNDCFFLVCCFNLSQVSNNCLVFSHVINSGVKSSTLRVLFIGI